MLIYKLIIQLSQTQSKEYQQLIFPKTKQIIQLVRKLTLEGYLYGYKPIQLNKPTYQQSYIQIYLKYVDGMGGVLTPLSKYHHCRLFKYISYKHLISLKNFAPLILLQSSKGLITHTEAMKYRIGGVIILICI